MKIFIWSSKENYTITATTLKDLINKVGLDEFKEYIECVYGEDYDTLTYEEKVDYMLDYYEDDEYSTLRYFDDNRKAIKYLNDFMNKRDEEIIKKIKIG